MDKEKLLVAAVPLLLVGCQTGEKVILPTETSLPTRPPAVDTATVTATLIPPTPIPTPTLRPPTPTMTLTRTPEATATPRPGRIEFLFDPKVPNFKREIIQKWLEISRRELGDAGDVLVYAYENPPDIEFWWTYPYIAFSSPGAIYLRTAHLDRLGDHSPTYLAVFPHEYFHVLQYHLVRRNFTEPMWFVEGSADYKMYRVLDKFGVFSYNKAREDWKRPAAIAARGNIPPLGQDMAQQREVFDVGFFKAELLAHLAGEESLTNYWKAARLTDWETAFRQTFGLSVAEFEAKFEDWRKHGYELKDLPK